MAKWSDKEAAIRALEKNGRVDPNDLISAAKHRSHPCHRDFTWDVERAAEERWRDQARYLIRKCRFEVTFEDVTSPVVQYVASNSEESVFLSLPKMKGKAAVRETMQVELDSLLGNVARVRGIANSKQNILGRKVISTLNTIYSLVEGLRDDLE